MALIATKDTYAYAAMGHGVMQRRFVKGGDMLPVNLVPVTAEDFRESEAGPAVLKTPTRKAVSKVDADEVAARAKFDKDELTIVSGDAEDPAEAEPDHVSPAGDSVAAPGPVHSKRGQHPSRRRAVKDDGDTGKDAE